MAMLSELTLPDLETALRAEAAKAKSKSKPKSQDEEAWARLIGIAEELNSSDQVDLLTRNRRWLLKQVTVEGFRGAKHKVKVDIDRAKGLTVLFGENGSGKSSLAEAVRVALEGRTGATHLGINGNVHELWGASDQRSQGSEKAIIEILLVDESTTDLLTVQAEVAAAGVTRRGTLRTGADQIELENDSPEWSLWSDAIRASPPVLAYAELADELQKKKDLQVWLTSCLAMDNASRVFDSRVKAYVDASTAAEKVIEDARRDTIRAINEVDAKATAQGVEEIAPLEWEQVTSVTDLNSWLVRNDLFERQQPDHLIDAAFLRTLPKYAHDFLQAHRNWTSAATKGMLKAQVTASIVDMHDRVVRSGQGDNGGICPTCGTLHTEWRKHLREEAARLEEAQMFTADLTKIVRRAERDLIEPLATCLAVMPPNRDADVSAVLAKLVKHAKHAVVGTDQLDVNLLEALESLAKWSERPEARSLMEESLAASGLEYRWRCNRWDALRPYVSAIREKIDLANRAATLRTARSKWNSYLANVRQERTASLHALVGPAVASLLGDVGISVASIAITKAESRLDLQNSKGESIELAHLSAGQRNALILGPVIATAESGIFAFSILDDPVHAFDDFRVDKLSSTLTQIGKSQSLLLTTHDARFVEYLRVHATLEFIVLNTSRDDDGQVSLTPTLDPPAELLKFARELAKDLDRAQASEGRAEVTALLRMATDEALEHIALRHFARLRADEAAVDRIAFDGAMLTKDRKGVLRSFLSDSPEQLDQLTRAWQRVGPASSRWSRAVHNPSSIPDERQLAEDIETAEEAVEVLRQIRW